LESEKPVVDFARVQTFTCVIGVGSPAGGAMGGRGDHRPDQAPFPADDGTPTPPADDQHSRQWHAQNGRGGGIRGSVTGEAQRPSAPRWRAGESPPPSVGRCWTQEGWARETVSSGRVSGAVAHLSKSRRAARRRDAIADRMLGMGDHRPAVGRCRPAHLMSALTRLRTVIFLVSYIHCRSRLKRPFLHCRADSVASIVISSRQQKHLFPLPLQLRYATVLCFAASVHLECGPRPPWSNKRSTDSKRGATGDNYPAHNRPFGNR